MGCGVNPLFKDSVKLDISHLKDVIITDLNKSFPLKNESFDTVVSMDVIEHLYDVDNFLSEIYRILKNGGKAIISTPNLISWRNRLNILLGKNP
ncbi:MAG: methyltransferase domain-containing protein, partial [Fervidobacterium sp.]